MDVFSDPFFGHSRSPFSHSPFFAHHFEEDAFSPFRAPAASRPRAASRLNPFEAQQGPTAWQRPGYGYPAGYPFGHPHARYANTNTPSGSSSEEEDESSDDGSSYNDPRHQQQARSPPTRAGPGNPRAVPVTSPRSTPSPQNGFPARGAQSQAPHSQRRSPTPGAPAAAAKAAAAPAPQAARRAVPKMSPSQAATRIQSVWRGRAVRAAAPLPKLQHLRQLQGQTDSLERQVAAAQAHPWGPAGVPEKERLRLAEGAMAVLLKLDEVQSPLGEVRARRKALARRLNALHDRVDALPRPSDTAASPVAASPVTVSPVTADSAPASRVPAEAPRSPRSPPTVTMPSPPSSPSPSPSPSHSHSLSAEDDDGASFHSALLSPTSTLKAPQEGADAQEDMDVDEVSSPAADVTGPSADITAPTSGSVSAPTSPRAQQQGGGSPAASEVYPGEALVTCASAPPSLAGSPTHVAMGALARQQVGVEAALASMAPQEAPKASWRNPFRRFRRRAPFTASSTVQHSKVPRQL